MAQNESPTTKEQEQGQRLIRLISRCIIRFGYSSTVLEIPFRSPVNSLLSIRRLNESPCFPRALVWSSDGHGMIRGPCS
jgi:hypothetical protein